MKNKATARGSATRKHALDRGRESFRKQAWGAAFTELSAAERESVLDPEHLVELAQAALLIGKDAEGAEYLTRAHQRFLSRGETQASARCAFWLGFTSLLNGEVAKAGGWLSRANRLLEGHPDCVEKGYLLLPIAFSSFHARDAVTAYATFVQAGAIGERFDDKDLVTLGLQGQGRALIRQGQIARGLELLDEAMVAVTAGEVSPLNAGGVYCSVLDACGEIFDLQRAHEWTTALETWCASQPDVVPYRAHCLVRRSEIMQLHGAWSNALDEAERASELLSRPPPKPFIGAALYQLGEIHRLRGMFAAAEEAYDQARQWDPGLGPGLAQLRLSQGHVDAALSAIRRAVEDVKELAPRAKVLDAYVEIAIAANDVVSARTAAEELAQIKAQHDAPFLRAISSRAAGAVLLAEGDARGALTELKLSWAIWSELQAPHEASRVRILVALAYRKLGDEDSAIAEFSAARETFRQLGAHAELSRVESLLSKHARRDASPLTGRELEVLRLVASGMTNRAISGKLFISEKTVARHVSNIFTKLGLFSRTAATAYAYDNKLL